MASGIESRNRPDRRTGGAGRPGLIVLLSALMTAGGAAAAKGGDMWLGAFQPFPGAHRICEQFILGSSDGKKVEIHFELYGSRREPEETARFYEKAYGMTIPEGSRTITVKLENGRNLLSVHPVAASYPQCGKQPDPEDRTVIVVSVMMDLEGK